AGQAEVEAITSKTSPDYLGRHVRARLSAGWGSPFVLSPAALLDLWAQLPAKVRPVNYQVLCVAKQGPRTFRQQKCVHASCTRKRANSLRGLYDFRGGSFDLAAWMIYCRLEFYQVDSRETGRQILGPP